MSHGQCKNGQSNDTQPRFEKNFELGAGVIRFADISIILTVGYVNNAY